MTTTHLKPTLSPRLTRTLLALVAVHRCDGRATVRAVARAAHRSINPTHASLRELQRRGFATGLGTVGALRPTVAPVRWGIDS